jgi:hypothetical protein
MKLSPVSSRSIPSAPRLILLIILPALLLPAGCKTQPTATSSPHTDPAPAPSTPAAPAVPAADASPSASPTLDQQADAFIARLTASSASPPAASDQPTAQPASAATDPAPRPEVQWTSPLPARPAASPTPASPTIPSTQAGTAQAPAPAAPSASPPPAAAALTTADHTQRLIAQLKRDAAVAPAAVKPYLALAALSLVDPSRELTEADLAPLAAEDRQLVLAYQRAFTLIARSTSADPLDQRRQLRLAADELTEQLTAHQPLAIRTAHLCTKVSGYGIYTPFTSTTFLAGREHPVIIYAELDQFLAKPMPDGNHSVRLTQEVTLYNEADGLAVWRVKPTEIADTSRNRRRDFFVVQIVQLPATLSVGRYILSLTVTDVHGSSLDEAKLPIQIIADSSATPPTDPRTR